MSVGSLEGNVPGEMSGYLLCQSVRMESTPSLWTCSLWSRISRSTVWNTADRSRS